MSDEQKPIGVVSVDTSLLAGELAKTSVGDVLTYHTMSEKIGRDVQGVARTNLTSARRIVQRENNMVFGAVSGVGVKRLDDVEISATSDDTLARIRRASHRGIKRMACVVVANLNNAQRIEFNTRASALGMLNHVTKSGSMKRLETVVADNQEKLAIGKTLEAFRN